MEAKEKALTFLREQFIYVVPYFQRGYVWDEENWEGIWQELTANREDSFLGSIILKEEKYPGKEEKCKTVIDGQQRLTTLTILLRAFLDFYSAKGGDAQTLDHFKELIFYRKTEWLDTGSVTTESSRIEHSRLNKQDYVDVIEGNIDVNLISANTDPKQGPVASKILRCYKYYYDTLFNASTAEINRARQKLIVDSSKIMVVIDLNERENEQVIFDTINSTGVKLTASDIIKNALFQKIKQTGSSLDTFYRGTWEKCFEDTQTTVNLWLETKGLGQNQRSNIDLFFYSFAIIKGFFKVPGDKMSDLATRYKEHISNFSEADAKAFVTEICKYAELYKDTFIGFDNITSYSFDDAKLRLLQILDAVKITAFDAFILFTLKTCEESKQIEVFEKLERYVIRHYTIGNSTKMGSFLQDAVSMINGTFDFSKALSDDLISDIRLEKALKDINNTKAKLILFWIELHRHTNPNSDLYNTPLNFAYELEHIMPQKWGEYWSLADLPIYDENGQALPNEDAARMRGEAVYEIGNMTLLTSRLNKKLRNYAFAEKVNGALIDKTQRPGMKEFASLSITKEVINRDPLVWDENAIHERTKELVNEFMQIWPTA